MNSEIYNYIEKLTKCDTKTITQKLSKSIEELGELASVVLPFDGADGTLHRFVDRTQILEECVDVTLSVLSIASQIGCTELDLHDMMLSKCKKWDTIQHREGMLGNKPIPYEIHVTVSPETNFDEFKLVCEDLGVKPLKISMNCEEGVPDFIDIMTSSVHFGDNNIAITELSRIVNALKDNGFDVIREKIETVPWHPAAPDTGTLDVKWRYFESHTPVQIPDSGGAELSRLVSKIALDHNAKLSRNLSKPPTDSYTQMLTLREYNTNSVEFTNKTNELVNALNKHCGCEGVVEPVNIEFVIHDSNINHDKKWIV